MRDYTASERFTIWLASVETLGARRARLLVDRFGGAQAVWEEFGEHMRFVGDAAFRALREARDPRYLEALFEGMRKGRMEALTDRSTGYPPLLSAVDDAPLALYVRGRLDLAAERPVAIVGSRNATPYGQRMAYRLARDLAEAGVTIVSGLAYGVDAMAHKGAVDAGGRTLAVMGRGLDAIYPPSNEALAEAILATGGSLISEYRPGSPPIAAHFPPRNRIISGLSRGVVVVEADEGSGASITVKFAAEQNREVFAVPGQADSRKSRLPHALIRDGATLTASAEDVLSAFGWDGGARAASLEAPPALTAAEKRLYDALEGGPRRVDELMESLRLSAPDFNSLLTSLQIQGIISQSPGSTVERTLKL